MRRARNMRGRRKSLGIAVACLLSASLLASASPGMAQGSSENLLTSLSGLREIENKLRELDGRIAELEADGAGFSRLREDIARGEIILFSFGDSIVPVTAKNYAQMLAFRVLNGTMTREQLKDEISGLSKRTRASIAAIDGFIRENNKHIASMKARRTSLVNQRATQTRPPSYGTLPQSAGIQCSPPHSWRNETEFGTSVWSVDAAGKATESGMGNATGSASWSGSGVTIHFRTGNLSGRYVVGLDQNCSGTGQLIFDTPPGARTTTVRFTSQGRN